MKRYLVLVTFCFLLLPLNGCVRHGNIYIAPGPPPTIEGYAKPGAIVQWNVMSKDAKDSFTILFIGTPPCETATSKYTASPGNPATCKIKAPRGYKKRTDLRFEYKILPSGQSVPPPDRQPPGGPPPRPGDNQIFFQHVGSCDTCIYGQNPPPDSQQRSSQASSTGSQQQSTTASSTIPTTYTVTVSCPPVTAPVDPTPLYVLTGDLVFWNNPNGAARPKFTITFDDPTACKNNVTSPNCVVAGKPGDSSASYPYHVTLGNGNAPNGCKVDGALKITQPPPAQ
jgi:hypothetical protein